MREISPHTMWIHNSKNSCTDFQSHKFIPTSNKYYNNFSRVLMPKISIKKRVQSTSIYTKYQAPGGAFMNQRSSLVKWAWTVLKWRRTELELKRDRQHTQSNPHQNLNRLPWSHAWVHCGSYGWVIMNETCANGSQTEWSGHEIKKAHQTSHSALMIRDLMQS